MPICLLDSMEETWSLHETVLFRNSFETQCEEIFDHILSSYGKPRTKLIDRVVKSILVFFYEIGYDQRDAAVYSLSAVDENIGESPVLLDEFKGLFKK